MSCPVHFRTGIALALAVLALLGSVYIGLRYGDAPPCREPDALAWLNGCARDATGIWQNHER